MILNKMIGEDRFTC